MNEQLPLNNLLLAGLSTSEHKRLSRHLVVNRVGVSERLLVPEASQDALHFIEAGLVAVRPMTGVGRSVSVALIGAEGMLGLGRIIGASRNHRAEAVALTALIVWTLAAEPAHREFARGGAFQRNLLYFGHALTEQIARTALCHGQHSLDMRLGRWLLLALDRLPGDQIPITHAAIARMLGVRRASVSEAAARLEYAGLIERMRGGIRIPDHSALESAVCDCYEMIRTEYDAQRVAVATTPG